MPVARLLPQRLQYLHQFGVDELIAADHAAGLERVVVALDAADDAAGLAQASGSVAVSSASHRAGGWRLAADHHSKPSNAPCIDCRLRPDNL